MKEIRLTVQQYQLFTALCLLLGEQDQDYIPALVDKVEWTDVKYGHQN